MRSPRVSIIITSCNQEQFLREAIESAINQTWKPFEIIVADDHSTSDASVDLIRGYRALYPGWIKAIFQKENVGIPRNRNSALDAVTGEYVAILDGDDRLLPGFIESHISGLMAQPPWGASYGNRYNVGADGEQRVRITAPEPSGNILGYVASGRMGMLRSMLARVDLVREAGGLDDRFPYHDGFILSLRLAKVTSFAYLPQPLMEKREHPSGVSKRISREERISCYTDILAEVQAVTRHFSSHSRQHIREKWIQRIFRERVLLENEKGRSLRALFAVAANTFGNPKQLPANCKLTREIFRSTGPVTQRRTSIDPMRQGSLSEVEIAKR